jgi:hypothetical protein
LEFNAFELIRDSLKDTLAEQGFTNLQELEYSDGKAEMLATDELAYGLFYSKKQMRFELKSTTLDDEGKPGDWKSLSMWLFDEKEGTRADVASIANDFLEIVSGPKRVAVVKQKTKKSNKKDERNVDLMFFFNRLANIFPAVKEAIRKDRIEYGQIRFAVMAKEKVASECDSLAKSHGSSELFEKLCTLFSDMYADGDLDVRSVLTVSILNNVSEDTLELVQEKVSDELKKDLKFTRKLIGKNIKPEKPKKEKKVVSRLGDR